MDQDNLTQTDDDTLKKLQQQIKALREDIEATDKAIEYCITESTKDLIKGGERYNLLSDQIDKLYYLFFINSACILLMTLPTTIKFIISFFN